MDSSDFITDDSITQASKDEELIPLTDRGGTLNAFLLRKEGKNFFLKKLKPEFVQDQRYRELFRKEFDLGQSLDNPHFVKYISLQDDEKGMQIMMEYIQGATLEQKLKAAPEWFRSRAHLDRFLSQLLNGLNYLHAKGIVHADLKPQNIMLTRINNDVKIIDLGFAYSDSYTVSTGCTLQFAAPEQAPDGNHNLDTRTDIYAVGKILEYLEQRSGTDLPKVYGKIKQRCLQQAKEKRFQHVDEILHLVLRRKRRIRNLIATGTTLLFLFMLGYFYINTSTERQRWESFKWTIYRPNYDFEYNLVYYKYLTPERNACEVVGGRVSFNGAGMQDGDDIRITAEHQPANGEVCRTVAIADSAFYQGKTFTSVYLPEGIERIGTRAFSECPEINFINVPSSVQKIGNYAFSEMNHLISIRLPHTLRELSIGMLSECFALESVRLPKDVKVLPMDLLGRDTMLTEVILPDSLERIERGVFWECRNLTRISLPSTLKYIGEYAFFYCTKLRHIYCHATEPPKALYSFKKNEKAILHVPKGTKKRYEQASDWNHLTIVDNL